MIDPQRNSQWEDAMRGESPPDGDADLRLLAEATRQALLDTGDSLSPSDETTRRAWQRLEQQAQAQGMFDERYRWLDGWLQPRRLALSLSLTLAVGAAFLWWTAQYGDSGIVIVAMRGDATVITVSDADAETPVLARELLALNLSPEITRVADGTRIDVVWPAQPSAEASAWLAEKGFHLSADGKLHLYLVKPSP